MRDDCSPQTVRLLVHRIYRSIRLAVAPALEVVFDRIEAGQMPVLLHCSARKDRTPISIARGAKMLASVVGKPLASQRLAPICPVPDVKRGRAIIQSIVH